MTPWQEFYQSIRDASWPDCNKEEDFSKLPSWIQDECCNTHGYQPGEFRSQSSLVQKVFPIVTETACQLKWTWSTVYLTEGTTASCHRTNHHKFDVEKFDFHNTPEKLNDRTRMLQGLWPERGCEYCRNIEAASGQSDRITNNNMPGVHAPPELDHALTSTSVTPRILEVYFNNTCNLKCVYCGPYFSSLWAAEIQQHGAFSKNGLIIQSGWKKDPNLDSNKKKMFDWIKKHAHTLTRFNVLGGEPLYQVEFDQCLDLFESCPAPNLDLEIFSNLNTSITKLEKLVEKIQSLRSRNHIRNFAITASLDCWGPSQEYARFPLKLDVWQKNFEFLLQHDWIRLIIGSTVTPLTVYTLPDLMKKINQWREHRMVYHYFNSVVYPSFMAIDMFGDIFQEKFKQALELADPSQESTEYLKGLARQSVSGTPNHSEILKLYTFLTELDRRRSTDWKTAFPWLVDPFKSVVDQ